jgi:hypothetical protein
MRACVESFGGRNDPRFAPPKTEARALNETKTTRRSRFPIERSPVSFLFARNSGSTPLARLSSKEDHAMLHAPLLRFLGVASAICGALVACSSSGGSSGGAPDGYCRTYGASCSSSESDIKKCEDRCTGKDPSASSTCWFHACGVMVGKCDKAEPGDRSIVTCAAEHRWFDACAKLGTLCSHCDAPADCDAAVARADAVACADFQIAHCE